MYVIQLEESNVEDETDNDVAALAVHTQRQMDQLVLLRSYTHPYNLYATIQLYSYNTLADANTTVE